MNKKIIYLFVALSYLFIGCSKGKPVQDNIGINIIQYEQPLHEPSINMVYYQDATGSIMQTGVEIIRSSVFSPYFEDIHRNIELNFGIINENSAHKLITLELPKAGLKKPILPDLSLLSITEQNTVKRKYAELLQTYQQDSTRFFSDRNKRIRQFCTKADSLLDPYRLRLSGSTDLIPVFKIADKAFNFFFAGSAQNYLLLNTDGLDSYRRIPSPLANKAEIIIINSNGLPCTCIDAVVTKTLQSTEQAIEFTLSNHK